MGWIKANLNDELHGKVKAYRDNPDTEVSNMAEAAHVLISRGVESYEHDMNVVLNDE